MNITFLTEMGFEGKVPSNHPNMRTEFAWMYALDAIHCNLFNYKSVKDQDHVFVIFPKGETFLNAVGVKLVEKQNPVSQLLTTNFIDELKNNNTKVHYIQEGPSWFFNDYEIVDQLNFYNLLSKCDSIFAHNEHDVKFYKGLFPNKPVNVIRTLLIEELISHITPHSEEKVIIGGNFAKWYGGFQSYVVSHVFAVDKWTQDSHAKRPNEQNIPDLNHLQRLPWAGWMNVLSTFKYAVHLMPTIAAGTFSLNCAYFGIPCIGNIKVDTQRICHPELSVDVEDVKKATDLAYKLKNDKDFYNKCSLNAKKLYRENYDIKVWRDKINLK